MTKRPDSLADFIHAWTYDERPAFKGFFNLKGDWPKMEKQGKQTLREAIRRAERFVLSDDFIRRAVARASGDVSQTLANADLARLPYDTLLVEFDDNVKYQTQLANPDSFNTSVEEGMDLGRGGYLFTRYDSGWQATHLSSSVGSMPVWPINCVLRSPSAESLDMLLSDRHKLFGHQIMASGWGYMVKNDNNLGFAMHRELMARGYAFLEPFLMMPLQKTAGAMQNKGNGALLRGLMQFYQAWANENSGSLRLATAILASLNTVPTKRVHRVATGTYQHRLRNIPNLSVTDVSIDAKPGHETAVYDRAFREAIRHNRRHEVRGHWRDIERHGALIGCPHEPGIVEGDYALCTKCTHLLRWIDHHERGDEKLGWVIHGEYGVQ